ncbi:unnamed protein product, partial [Polarella glacialis]
MEPVNGTPAASSEDLAVELVEAKRCSALLGDELEDAGSLRALGVRLRALRARLQQDVSLAKSQASKVQRLVREEFDAKAAEDVMPLVTVVVEEVEDAVEAVFFQAGDLDWRRTQMETAMKYSDEFGDDIEKALDETQEATDKAQAALDAARARIDSQ